MRWVGTPSRVVPCLAPLGLWDRFRTQAVSDNGWMDGIKIRNF